MIRVRHCPVHVRETFLASSPGWSHDPEDTGPWEDSMEVVDCLQLPFPECLAGRAYERLVFDDGVGEGGRVVPGRFAFQWTANDEISSPTPDDTSVSGAPCTDTQDSRGGDAESECPSRDDAPVPDASPTSSRVLPADATTSPVAAYVDVVHPVESPLHPSPSPQDLPTRPLRPWDGGTPSRTPQDASRSFDPPSSDPPSSDPPSSDAGASNDIENEPEWLRDAVVGNLSDQSHTHLVLGTTVEVALKGVFPPEQLLGLARQNVTLRTKEGNTLRVFLVRKALRVGPLTIDADSWDPLSSTYSCLRKESGGRVRADTDGNVLRFHRARRDAFERR